MSTSGNSKWNPSDDEGAPSRYSVSVSTGVAVRQLEEQLISAIATCEEDLRRGADDLARLKDALRSLRRQRQSGLRPAVQRSEHVRTVSENKRAPTARTSREREGSAANQIRAFARLALRRAGRPLTRVEILERMEEAGIKIEAKVPVKRIAKVMWSSPEFVNVGDGYWFVGEPVPLSPHGDST